MELSQDFGTQLGEKIGFELLSDIHGKLGNYEKAFVYQQKLMAVKDSILNEEKARQINELQTKYETAQKEKEIALLQKEQEQQTLIRNAVLDVFVLIGIIGILFYNRQRLKIQKNETELENTRLKEQKLEQELEFKNKQLTTHTLHLVQKNEAMQELKDKIGDLRQNGNGDINKGVEASLIGASDTELPEGAGTGPVNVMVEGETAEGPVFTIDPAQFFEGKYLSQSYQMELQNFEDTTLTADTTFTIEKSSKIEIALIDNSTNEVKIDLKGFLEDGFNTLPLEEEFGKVIFDFEKAPIGEISENKFEIDDTNFEIKLDGEILHADIFGSGILQEDTITVTFEYTIYGPGSVLILSADTDFERE